MIFSGMIEVIQDTNGNIRTIDGKFTDKAANSVEDAIHILNCASTLFGNKFDANNGKFFEQHNGDETFYRYSPRINGIPVMGNQIILASKNGKVTGLFSTYDSRIENVNTVSQISSIDASEIALNDIFDTYQEIVDSLVDESGLTSNEIIEILKGSLTIDSALAIYNDADAPKLSWIISLKNEYVYDDDGDNDISIDYNDIYDYGNYVLSFLNSTYYIGANGVDKGNILYIDDGIREWSPTTANATDLLGLNRVINVECGDVTTNHRMADSDRNIKTYTTKFVAKLPQLPGKILMSTDNTWPNAASVSAHANMAEVYDYYYDVLGWKSYDNNGAIIKTSISYKKKETEDYNNACWNSKYQQFLFGNIGIFEAALDVVGHEYTHAVIDNKVYDGVNKGLTYYGETGALEESYADIMGSLIEGKNTADKWLIGEDMSRVLRSMQQPSNYGDPEHYTNLYTGTSDNGGVHTNSGIFNFAAYKMMTDSRTSSITSETWAKVFFNSLNRLTTSSLFLDARGAIISSAKSLGFNHEEQQAIKDAFESVGITDPNSIRIALRWGASPNDLDSHLTGPNVNGNGRFHIYYGARNYFENNSYSSSESIYAADLDYDDTSSFGPEITTIRTLTPGDYYFYVYDYSNQSDMNSSALSNSGANVTLYKGASNTPLKLPDGSNANFIIKSGNTGTLWSVCKISIDLSGNVTITPIDSISYHAGGSGTVGS